MCYKILCILACTKPNTMNPILRNIIAVIFGVVACMGTNMFIIGISGKIIPLPEGVDPNNLESIKENLHLYEFKHFIMPFLAHALGSLVGAFLAALIAATKKMTFAYTIGCFHLLGGIAAAVMIPAPTWFIVTDLALAYIPMAWIGGKLVKKK